MNVCKGLWESFIFLNERAKQLVLLFIFSFFYSVDVLSGITA